MIDFLDRILKKMDQSGPGALEFQMIDLLNRILKEIDQSSKLLIFFMEFLKKCTSLGLGALEILKILFCFVFQLGFFVLILLILVCLVSHGKT